MLALCIAGSYRECANRSGIVSARLLAISVLCRGHSRSLLSSIKGVAVKGYTVTVTFFRLVLFSSSLVLAFILGVRSSQREFSLVLV